MTPVGETLNGSPTLADISTAQKVDGHQVYVMGELRKRLNDLELQHRNYLTYLNDRVREHDWHGAWDCCINLSEVECEQSGIRRAMDLLTGVA